MKRKHGYIGNSSSASYYIRRGNHTEVDKPEELGLTLDTWYSWHPKHIWYQTQHIAVASSLMGVAPIGFKFYYGACVKNNTTCSSFSSPAGTEAGDFTGLVAGVNNVKFGVNQREIQAYDSGNPITESDNGVLVLRNLPGLFDGANWGDILYCTPGVTSSALPPATGTFVVACSWNGTTEMLHINAAHKIDAGSAVASTAMILKGFEWLV